MVDKTDLVNDGPELEGIVPREKMKVRTNEVYIQMIKGVRAKVGAHGCDHGRGGHVGKLEISTNRDVP